MLIFAASSGTATQDVRHHQDIDLQLKMEKTNGKLYDQPVAFCMLD